MSRLVEFRLALCASTNARGPKLDRNVRRLMRLTHLDELL